MKKKKTLAHDNQQNLCVRMLKGAKVKNLRNLRKSYDQELYRTTLFVFIFEELSNKKIVEILFHEIKCYFLCTKLAPSLFQFLAHIFAS